MNFTWFLRPIFNWKWIDAWLHLNDFSNGFLMIFVNEFQMKMNWKINRHSNQNLIKIWSRFNQIWSIIIRFSKSKWRRFFKTFENSAIHTVNLIWKNSADFLDAQPPGPHPREIEKNEIKIWKTKKNWKDIRFKRKKYLKITSKS